MVPALFCSHPVAGSHFPRHTSPPYVHVVVLATHTAQRNNTWHQQDVWRCKTFLLIILQINTTWFCKFFHHVVHWKNESTQVYVAAKCVWVALIIYWFMLSRFQLWMLQWGLRVGHYVIRLLWSKLSRSSIVWSRQRKSRRGNGDMSHEIEIKSRGLAWLPSSTPVMVCFLWAHIVKDAFGKWAPS